MITAVSLRNFKRFRQQSVPLRHLTVLSGLNGAGKTSILHALLLVHQAAQRPQPSRVPLNGTYGLILGEATDVLHGEADPEEGIEIGLDTAEGERATWVFGIDGQRTPNLEIRDTPKHVPPPFGENGRAFVYLSAERLGPRDSLGIDSSAVENISVGVQGEFTAQVLAVSVSSRLKVSNGRLCPDSESVAFVRQTELWMSRIVRPMEISADWLPNASITSLRFKSPGVRNESTRPANIGFGVTYSLPIVVAGLLAPSGGILIVENPEAHLHPAGQSAIGAFLATVASDGVQVIVETHSEHVVNGIRRAATEQPRVSHEGILIDFIDAAADGTPRVEALQVADSGSLSRWPRGFFDQATLDMAALARVRKSHSK